MVPPFDGATGVVWNARAAFWIGEVVVTGVGRMVWRRGVRRRKRGDGRVAAMLGKLVGERWWVVVLMAWMD